MVSKVYLLFLFSFCIVSAYRSPKLETELYTKAYSQLYELVRDFSPYGNISYFMCKHGPPGEIGFLGPCGYFDLPEYGSQKLLLEYMTRFLPPSVPPECSIEVTVKFVMEKLKKLKQPCDETMQIGPPGRVGKWGYNASTLLGIKLADHCFKQKPIDKICDFHTDLEKEMTDLITDMHRETTCPAELQGHFGPKGRQGESGFYQRDIEPDWDRFLNMVYC